MNEKEQLGALYAIAQEQQAATASAVAALQQQTGAVNTAVKALGRAVDALGNLPAQVMADSTKAAHEGAVHAISEALDTCAKTSTENAKAVAETAAADFVKTAKIAAQAATQAAVSAREAVRSSGPLALVVAFLAGAMLGAGGLYLLHTPKAQVYLDTARVAQEVAAVCRKR